jgi:hypothetical protein
LTTKFPFLADSVDLDACRTETAKFLGIEPIMMLNIQSLMSNAIEFVNRGYLDKALVLCTYLLRASQDSSIRISAYVTRGSAFAMSEDMQGTSSLSRLRGDSSVYHRELQLIVSPVCWRC